MPVSYSISLPDPTRAHGEDASVAFSANGAEAFAAQLQTALADPAWFARWRARQPDPDQIDPRLGSVDPGARVSGRQHDLGIDLVAVTSLPGDILKLRLQALAGHHWQLRDVTAAG